jgi:hypothetical protein
MHRFIRSAQLTLLVAAGSFVLVPLAGAFDGEAQDPHASVVEENYNPNAASLGKDLDETVSNPIIASEEQDSQAVSSGTWQFVSRENCYDLWTVPCSYTVPANQCSSNPAGLPCSPGNCWLVISPGWVDSYTCS